jgi:hypothetical protein
MQDHVNIFNYVAGTVPFIKNLIADVSILSSLRDVLVALYIVHVKVTSLLPEGAGLGVQWHPL